MLKELNEEIKNINEIFENGTEEKTIEVVLPEICERLKKIGMVLDEPWRDSEYLNETFLNDENQETVASDNTITGSYLGKDIEIPISYTCVQDVIKEGPKMGEAVFAEETTFDSDDRFKKL